VAQRRLAVRQRRLQLRLVRRARGRLLRIVPRARLGQLAPRRLERVRLAAPGRLRQRLQLSGQRLDLRRRVAQLGAVAPLGGGQPRGRLARRRLRRLARGGGGARGRL